jgi:uncharacterized cupredoxin-like copper-binding protein
MSKKIFLLTILMAALAAGCGGGGPVEVTVTLTDFAFEPASFSAPAGAEVSLTIQNNGALEHNFLVMNAGAEVADAWNESEDAANVLFQQTNTAAGTSVTATFTAPTTPGDYQFLCSVPAHFEQGMHGTMTVTP